MARDQNSARQNTRLRAIEKTVAEQDDEAFKVVMATEDGRRVLSRMARDCSWMGEGWDANNARQTDFNAGKRGAALEFMAWAERVAPEDFLLMLGEATRRDVEQATLAKAATIDPDKEQDDG